MRSRVPEDSQEQYAARSISALAIVLGLSSLPSPSTPCSLKLYSFCAKVLPLRYNVDVCITKGSFLSTCHVYTKITLNTIESTFLRVKKLKYTGSMKTHAGGSGIHNTYLGKGVVPVDSAIARRFRKASVLQLWTPLPEKRRSLDVRRHTICRAHCS